MLGITALAPVIGPHLAGLLAPFPFFTATLAAFAQHQFGGGAAISVLRGLLLGLIAFASFMFTLALLLVPAGLAGAFAASILVAIAFHASALWLLRRGTGYNSSMSTLTLAARHPFEFNSVVESHGWMQLAPFRHDEQHQTLFYTDCLQSGRVIEFGVCAAPSGIRVDVPGRLGKGESQEVSEKVH